jgi:hypothetical protein
MEVAASADATGFQLEGAVAGTTTVIAAKAAELASKVTSFMIVSSARG